MEKVRIGIVGLGGMGSAHARYLADGKVNGAVLSAVCDTESKRLANVHDTFGPAIQVFENIEALLASKCCDGVLVATPHYDHPPLVIQALNAGLHALCEKPAGVYTRQVKEMNKAAAASDRVFGIMFNQRTSPVYRKARDLVAEGEIGSIQRTNWIVTSWYRSQSYYDSGGWRASWGGEGGGVLINQCPHNLDLWQWICGMPTRVRAFCSFGKYHNIEVEDEVTAYVEYENGATGVFVTSTGEAPGTNRLEIAGDLGKLTIEGGSLVFQRNRIPTSQFNIEFKGGFGAPECWECHIPTPGTESGHQGLTQDWVNAIRTGSPLLGPGEEGIRSLSISNAMLLSSWTDDWVQLPLDDDLFHTKLQEHIKNSTYKKNIGEGRVMNVDGTF